jgi:hypothetical protein
MSIILWYLKTHWGSIVSRILTAAGGAITAKHLATEPDTAKAITDMNTIIGALVTLVPFLYHLFQKVRDKNFDSVEVAEPNAPAPQFSTNVQNVTNAASKVVPAILVAIGLLAASGAQGQVLQTNPSPTWLAATLDSIATHGSVLPTGISVDLHGDVAPSTAQMWALFKGGSNEWWSVGLIHATVFRGDAVEQLGIGACGGWETAPNWLRFALFNAGHVQYGASVTEDVNGYIHGFAGYDWKLTTFSAWIGRKF